MYEIDPTIISAEWENALERSLRTAGAMRQHIPHMYAIGRLADQYLRHMGPVVVRVRLLKSCDTDLCYMHGHTV